MPARPEGRNAARAPKFLVMLVTTGLMAAAPVCASAAAAGAGYPSKPIRMVVPLAAGGTTDIVARIVAQIYSEALGQTVVVDNRAGAGGTIGAGVVARALPDGYTLLFHSVSRATSVPVYELPYDPVKEIVGVVRVGESV